MTDDNAIDADTKIANLIQHIEIGSAIAMQKSIEDGDPKHHIHFIEKYTAEIKSLLERAEWNARVEALDTLIATIETVHNQQVSLGDIKAFQRGQNVALSELKAKQAASASNQRGGEL